MNDETLIQKVKMRNSDAFTELMKSQMQSMYRTTDAEVDRIYLAYCASNSETGGGYNRELSESERQRYEELKEQYENEGVYSELELKIIKTLDEYTGSGVAFCEENSTYCLPGGELSDAELLQVIDFDHKINYCFSRLIYEIQMGLREGYPKTE